MLPTTSPFCTTPDSAHASLQRLALLGVLGAPSAEHCLERWPAAQLKHALIRRINEMPKAEMEELAEYVSRVWGRHR